MKRAWTSLFWVGEPSGPENAFIPNTASYWDQDWQRHFGGVDNPEKRKDFHPARFKPKENPFYCALPYGDLNGNNMIKPSAVNWVPWYKKWRAAGAKEPLLKNRWVHIVRKIPLNDEHHSTELVECYAQWQDVGPCEEEDWAWVFGKSENPLSSFNKHAGLDLSPACRTALRMEEDDWTEFEFVEFDDVPPGPWKEIVTKSGINR